MSTEFEANPHGDAQRFDSISEMSPGSPFNTAAYADAAVSAGLQPYSLCVIADRRMVDGCLGLMTAGSWRRRLEIPSIPRLREPDVFWAGVERFCDDNSVTDLQVDSFASEEARLPAFRHRLSHRQRREYSVNLEIDLDAALSKSHRKNIKKARKADLTITRTGMPAACRHHLMLMAKSASRRTARGELVDIPPDCTLHAALLKSGAGEIFQACAGDDIYSSIMIIKGPKSAYYHSAGTSPAGMKSGASPFLISEVARTLQREGFGSLNLGGADTDGLREFKFGFGAVEVPLEAASYSMISPGRRNVRWFVHIAKRVPAKAREFWRARN